MILARVDGITGCHDERRSKIVCGVLKEHSTFSVLFPKILCCLFDVKTVLHERTAVVGEGMNEEERCYAWTTIASVNVGEKKKAQRKQRIPFYLPFIFSALFSFTQAE